jgi:hypothetical protein
MSWVQAVGSCPCSCFIIGCIRPQIGCSQETFRPQATQPRTRSCLHRTHPCNPDPPEPRRPSADPSPARHCWPAAPPGNHTYPLRVQTIPCTPAGRVSSRCITRPACLPLPRASPSHLLAFRPPAPCSLRTPSFSHPCQSWVVAPVRMQRRNPCAFSAPCSAE